MISQGTTGSRLYLRALLIALAALPTIEGYSQEGAIPKDAFIEQTTFTVEEVTVLKEPLVIEGDAAPGTVECKGFKDQIDALLKMTLNQTWPERLALYTRESAKQLEVTGAKEAFEKREIKSLEDARKIQTVILGFIRLK